MLVYDAPAGSNTLDVALTLGAQGLHVFFCSKLKIPTCKWRDRATADPALIRALWRDHPGSMVAVATGLASNICVLDIDHGKSDAAKSWFGEHRDRLPKTRVHATKSGGFHYLLLNHDGVGVTAGRIAEGIDTRGEGGFIVWWPGEIPARVLCNEPLAEVPDWIIEALKPRAKPYMPLPTTQTRFYEGAKVFGILRTVAGAKEGERNQVLYWAACRFAEMVARRLMSERYAVELCIEAASRTGLPRDEAERTALSALRAVGR
jgi:hypothetical protein